LIQQLLERKVPVVPRLNFPIVDVRDVAKAHVIAMTSKEASGKFSLRVKY
jgi:dihydroflavonol-4-reductase